MERHLAAGLAVSLLVAFAPGRAIAQDTAAPPPAVAPPAAVALPPAVPPAPPAAPRVASPPRRNLRINAHSEGHRLRVRIQTADLDGQLLFVCASPQLAEPRGDAGGVRRPFRLRRFEDCVADVAPGRQLQIKIGENEQTVAYDVPDDPAGELDLLVRPADGGAQKGGGVVLIVLGALGVGIGGVGLLAASVVGGSSAPAPFLVALGAGAAAIVGGIAVVSSGSREPRVEKEDSPHRAAESQARRDDVAIDDASARRAHGGEVLAAPITTPLSYGFSF